MTTSVDITPHPRILSVLKDIEFTMLQCFCELIDNSIDGFLDSLRAGQAIPGPAVNLGIGRDTITIHDNGPGMSLERLEHAISAGWTSKDGTSSLGLYGMGFNIATAKLGAVTTIWTTRVGDPVWHGVVIDLAALARGSSFKLPVRTRRKDDPAYSGTEVEISSIKPEWASKLTPGAIRNNITNPLGRIYKSMLREHHPHPIRFTLRVNNINVPAWEHCVWPETKTVTMKQSGEVIRAVESFDRTFETKYRSRTTGEVYDSTDGHDPADLIAFEERVHGWVGIQRCLDPNDYGIDIIRNGRVIELASKDLFYWTQEDDIKRKEYPIDDHRERGRIVGEIHLDHGYVFYTKKNFEHDHYSWHQLMHTVLHNEPLTKRDDKSPNLSPIGKIFRAFRRNSPQRPQTYSDILVIRDNEKAKLGVEGYRKGEPKYQNIAWWESQLAESDRADAPLTPAKPSVDLFGQGAGITPPNPTPGVVGPAPVPTGEGGVTPSVVSPLPGPHAGDPATPVPPVIPGIKRTHLPELDLRVNGPTSDRVYKATVYQVSSAPLALSLRGKPSGSSVFEIEVNPDHPVFQSSSFQLLDAVLAEFAHHVTGEENSRGSSTQIGFSEMLAALREQYRADNSLDPNRLSLDLGVLVNRVQSALTKTLTAEQQGELLTLLPQESVNRVQLAQARGAARKETSSLIDIHDLARIFRQRPELVMQSGCLRTPWEPSGIALTPSLLAEYQDEVRRRVGGVLDSLSGFAPRLEEPSTPGALFYMRAGLDMFKELLA
ncbi:ATP-binding protein [Deinococcus oregonensis]|uniref:ATP-binding protein n=1 Tax=Deinococcus oregonensis TaxID=1805970 RepID=A0ABV6AYE0_9DEIO